MLKAYQILCKIYAIAVATSVTSSTAERTFSALKRVKSRAQSSTVQDQLEDLLLMIFERKICRLLDYDKLIDTFGHGSQGLSEIILWFE